MADITQCLTRCLAETSGPIRIPDQPASAYLIEGLLSSAMDVVRDDPPLQEWMRKVGLDPGAEQDSLLAIGVTVAVLRRDRSYEAVPSR
jgi:hypothetical protein